jgi:hypothetical protein
MELKMSKYLPATRGIAATLILPSLLISTAFVSMANAQNLPFHKPPPSPYTQLTYDCSLLKEFPTPKATERNPIAHLTVYLSQDKKGEFRGLTVQYQMANGQVVQRGSQYRSYKESVQGDSYQWSGINIQNSDISMKGVLDVNSGDDQWSYYSEEMTEDGELKYAMVSQCSVRGGQYSPTPSRPSTEKKLRNSRFGYLPHVPSASPKKSAAG